MAMLGLGKLGLATIGIHEPSLLGNDFGFELHNTYYKIIRDNPVGQSTLARLEADTRVTALVGKMLSNGAGASRFDSVSTLAAWWLWRANAVGAEQANQELDSFLANDAISANAVLWVYGIEPAEPIKLPGDIYILHIRDMPDSSDKEEFLRTNLRFQGHGAAPFAALVKKYSARKLAPNMTIHGPEPGFDEATKGIAEAHRQLNAIATVLNCIEGTCCMPGYGTSYLPANVPLGPFASGGGGTPIFDVLPKRISRITTGHETAIAALASAYLKIADNEKTRLTRALHRLAQAKGRMDDGDRALDLGIALEMMLLNTEHGGQELPGQLHLHFRLRGSWLIGKTIDERKSLYRILGKIYNLRSQLAHNGFSDELNKMPHQDRDRMLAEHAHVAGRIFQKLILDGTPRDWPGLILGS